MLVNWESKTGSIEKAIGSWTLRNLSMVGEIQILKSLFGIKKILCSIEDLPQVFVNRIKMLYRFKMTTK